MAGPSSALFDLASGQRGLITRAQLVRAIPSDHQFRRLLEDGWLRRVRTGVYAVAGHQPSPWDPAVAALLLAGPGAVLSHRTAAGAHRFPGLRLGTGPPELTVVAPRHPELPGVIVHRVAALDPSDVTGRPPLILTMPVRTLVDVASTLSPGLLAMIVDEGTVAGWWTVDDLWVATDRRGRRRRVGRGTLRPLLEARRAEPRADTRLELAVIRALAPLAPFETQYQLVVDGRVVLLDIAWPRSRVAVEVDGFAAHGRLRTRFDADRLRDNHLAAHGWRIIHVTSSMDGATILDSVRRVLPSGGRPR